MSIREKNVDYLKNLRIGEGVVSNGRFGTLIEKNELYSVIRRFSKYHTVPTSTLKPWRKADNGK